MAKKSRGGRMTPDKKVMAKAPVHKTAAKPAKGEKQTQATKGRGSAGTPRSDASEREREREGGTHRHLLILGDDAPATVGIGAAELGAGDDVASGLDPDRTDEFEQPAPKTRQSEGKLSPRLKGADGKPRNFPKDDEASPDGLMSRRPFRAPSPRLGESGPEQRH